MSKLLVVILSGVMFVAVGCKSDDGGDDMSASSSDTKSTMSAGADACSHCAGVQTATADGKCPICSAKPK